MKFYIKDFFSKCHQILRKLQTCSHLLKKSLIPHFLCRDLIQSYLKNYKGRQLEFANFYSQLVSRIPKFDELSC